MTRVTAVLTREETNISILPSELLVEIVSYLPYPELSNLMLVSRAWREVVDDPSVWKQFSLSVDEHNVGILKDILDINRFGRLQKIKTGCGPFISELGTTLLFNLILNWTNLRHLELTNTNVCNVDPDIFSDAINSLETVNLDMNLLTFNQTKLLFNKMKEDTKLVTLSVKYNTLLSVDPVVLAKCLSQLRVLNLTNSHVNPEQVRAFFSAMKHQTYLVKLTLVEINITDVDAEVFASCANKLEYLKLTNDNNCCMTKHQVAALFCQAQHQTQLRELHMQTLDLSSVPPRVLGFCISRLRRCSIRNCRLAYKHASKDMFEVIAENTALDKLELCGSDLSTVDTDKLAATIQKLHTVDIGNCYLTNTQAVEVMESLNGNTQHLNLQDNDLSTIDATLLGNCSQFLRTLNLSYTRLQSCQVQTIFFSIIQGTRLNHLVISGNDLSSVEPYILAMAVTKLVTVEIKATHLTRLQIEAILQLLATEACTRLEYLDIARNVTVGGELDMMANQVIGQRPKIKICF